MSVTCAAPSWAIPSAASWNSAGHDVVRANYPGDMGLHVIKWLWGYLKYHNGEEPPADITKWMGEIYADANRRLEEDP